AWSPDGKWMYFSSNAGGAYHLWRQRFPTGRVEQVTSGTTEEEGIAMAPDGRSLATAVGTRRVVIAIHDSSGERPIISDGWPALTDSRNGSPFSSDGKKLYFLQLPRGSNDVGAAMMSAYVAGELTDIDLETGQSEPVFPGFSISSFALSPIDNRIAFVGSQNKGKFNLWMADLEHRSSPQPLPSKGLVGRYRFAGGAIYYVSREGDHKFVRRLRLDGSGDEVIWPNDFWAAAISPSGRYLALTNRAPEAQAGPRITTQIVDTRTGKTFPMCDECIGWWSESGDWFAIANETGSGEETATYLVPTRSGTELPNLPAERLRQAADASHLPGTVVIRDPGVIALGRKPGQYAIQRESVHRNLYRIPLK
ncbi:MAG: hypothetical protein ACRD3E_01190, partial [Terriglobales bacterium]